MEHGVERQTSCIGSCSKANWQRKLLLFREAVVEIKVGKLMDGSFLSQNLEISYSSYLLSLARDVKLSATKLATKLLVQCIATLTVLPLTGNFLDY